MRRLATITFLCTSNPHTRSYKTPSPAGLLFFLPIDAPPFFGAPRGHPAYSILLRVLSSAINEATF